MEKNKENIVLMAVSIVIVGSSVGIYSYLIDPYYAPTGCDNDGTCWNNMGNYIGYRVGTGFQNAMHATIP
jgi:hypothetical protein